MAKKTRKSSKLAPKPSGAAMAAAEAMLAPLRDLLVTSVRQNELNAQMLTDLNDRVVRLAGQLDQLQKLTPADPKLLTEPAPNPIASLLTEAAQ
jgi:hypothetical protein